MRISDWSSDVCSSDLRRHEPCDRLIPVDEQSKCGGLNAPKRERSIAVIAATNVVVARPVHTVRPIHRGSNARGNIKRFFVLIVDQLMNGFAEVAFVQRARPKTQAGAPSSGIVENVPRSEEHTSELQSLMRISYAVFCLTKKQMKK